MTWKIGFEIIIVMHVGGAGDRVSVRLKMEQYFNTSNQTCAYPSCEAAASSDERKQAESHFVM